MAGLQIRNIGIIGGGAWGLTLANLLAENGYNVVVWDRNPNRIENLKKHRGDSERLPGVKLNEGIEYTDNLRNLHSLDMHILSVKSDAVKDVIRKLSELHPKVVVSTVKGFVGNEIKLVSQYLRENLPDAGIFVLSGPSIAIEVCRKVPTSVVIAGYDEDILKVLQRVFSNSYFRVYGQEDIVGVEIAGALKNIIAIASGICDGLGLGENSKGALLTRGVYEILRFGLMFGARKETFYGLAGLGDIITTSFSKNSRNRHVGEMLGKGYSIGEILSRMVMVAEGVRTAFLVRNEATRRGIDMPITFAVCDVIEGNIKPPEAMKRLMERELKKEFYV